MTSNLHCASSPSRPVLLLLLDLSAAFDTVDHSTLLLRLRTRFGMKGSALAWFEFYLASRKYYTFKLRAPRLPFGPWILVYPRAQYWAHCCTELIVFSFKFRPRTCLSNVQIGNECREHSNTVRNLGVLFDQTLSFGEHVNKLWKSSHYDLRNISKIRKYLD